MKPICASCHLFFTPIENGFYFEEGMPVGEETNPNLDPMTTKIWASYKLWSGDLWECRGCGAQIVVGVAQSPIREHYQEDYKTIANRLGPAFRVDDC